MSDLCRPRMMGATFLLAVLLSLPGIAIGQKVGDAAHLFTGLTTTGESIRLADLKGKVVVLDFWASWCGPCREEMPYLMSLYDELKSDSLEILAINVDEKSKYMDAFLDQLEQRPSFPIIVDPKGTIASQYKLEGMPTTVFVDRDGIVQYVHTGFVDKDKKEYRDRITGLLAE